MIKETDEEPHKPMLSQQQGKRQRRRIGGNGDRRDRDVERSCGRVSGAVIELTLHKPLWWFSLESGFHRPEHTVNVMLIAGLEQGHQPRLGRTLVVVDESDEISSRLLNGLVPRQRYTLPRLHAVADRDTGRRCKVADHVSG